MWEYSLSESEVRRMFRRMFIVFIVMFFTSTAAKHLLIKTEGIVQHSTVIALTTPWQDSAEILQLLLLAPSNMFLNNGGILSPKQISNTQKHLGILYLRPDLCMQCLYIYELCIIYLSKRQNYIIQTNSLDSGYDDKIDALRNQPRKYHDSSKPGQLFDFLQSSLFDTSYKL